MKKNNNNNKRIYPIDNNNHDNGNDKTMIGRDVEETNNESTKKNITENGNENSIPHPPNTIIPEEENNINANVDEDILQHKSSSGTNRSMHQRLSQTLSESIDQMPQISAKLMNKIKRASKKGLFLQRLRRHSKTKRMNRQKKLLQHIALLHRFNIRDHEEDIIEKGLIEAERKLSLSHHHHKEQHSLLHKYNPIRILCSPKRVIDPNSWIRKGLNFLQSLCMLYIAFILPFELFFVYYEPRTYSFSSRPPVMMAFELIADVIFILNFISRFYTPFIRQDDGVWEVLPHRIALNNIYKIDFIFTVFAIVPLSIFAMMHGESMFLLIWRFVQVAARYYAYKSIESNFLLETEMRASGAIGFLHNLFNSIILIMGFLHWTTCFWYYMHPSDEIERIQAINHAEFYQAQNYESAILPEGVENVVEGPMAMVFDMKLALYFKFAYETLMIVIGENMEGHTPRQYIFLYIISFLGVCMIAGLFGQVGNIIASYSKERMMYLEKMKDTVRTMRYLQLPEDLRSRVIRYHEYVYNVFGSFETNKLRIFSDQLSKPLSAEVKLHCHTNLIRNVKLFAKLDSHISRYLIDCLVVEIYMPGDFVIREGEFDSRLYMIIKGTCHVLIRKKNKPVRVLKAGDYFGEVSLVTRVPRSATVRAQSFCNFAVISKEDYDSVKTDHQHAFDETEKVMMARLDSYKGINKKNRKIRRFSVSQDTDGVTDLKDAVAKLNQIHKSQQQLISKKKDNSIINSRKHMKKKRSFKLKRRRTNKEPIHIDDDSAIHATTTMNVNSNVIVDDPAVDTNSNGDEEKELGNDGIKPKLTLPPLPPIVAKDEVNNTDEKKKKDANHLLLSAPTEIKIMNKLVKKGKRAKKKVAHHINDKLSEIKKTQNMLKESMEQNQRGIDLILRSLSKSGIITE